MASNYVSKKYNVDIVFCIDATMSMYQILDKVKENTKNFYIDLTDAMAHKGKKVDQLRVRIVMFRDYYYDKEDAMFVTDFFNLPAQSAEFDHCVNSIEPKGGGDDPEDALEALAYAIRSDWTPADPEAKRRQVVVLWTDAAPHPLGFARTEPNYPKNGPLTMKELTAWWGAPGLDGYMDKKAKRLLLYAPEDPTWDSINKNWNNTIYFPSNAGDGLREFEYKQIIDVIAASI